MIFDKLKKLLDCYMGTGIQAPLAAGVTHANLFNEECGGVGWNDCGIFGINCDCDSNDDDDDDYDPYEYDDDDDSDDGGW